MFCPSFILSCNCHWFVHIALDKKHLIYYVLFSFFRIFANGIELTYNTMRKLTFWMLALAMVLALASCSEKDVPVDSATDPLPFPMDAYKDWSVSPGDDFYMYCNGG